MRFGLLLFPGVTQLDLTGPAEVFGNVADSEVHLLWKTNEPVTTGKGWKIIPTTTFEQCPALDVICVPGGSGQIALMDDALAVRTGPASIGVPDRNGGRGSYSIA